MGADLGQATTLEPGFVLHTLVAGVLVVVALVATMLVLLASAPAFAEGVRRNLAERRETNLVWAVLYALAAAAGAVALSWLGDLGFIAALVVATASAAFALMGLAVVSQEVGAKIGRLHSERSFSRLVAFLVGSLTVLSCSLIPILGWVLLSYFVANGLGAVLRVIAADIALRVARPARVIRP